MIFQQNVFTVNKFALCVTQNGPRGSVRFQRHKTFFGSLSKELTYSENTTWFSYSSHR